MLSLIKFEVENMYKIGDFVVNTNNGICEITDIVTMNLSGNDKEYFLLVPISEKTAKVYIPVDMAAERIRLTMSETEALDLIHGLKDIPEVYIENEKEREKTYKDALSSRDPKRLISIIKTLYLRKQKRIQDGKKVTAVDERYFKLAENQLHGELAFALHVEKSEVHRIIIENI